MAASAVNQQQYAFRDHWSAQDPRTQASLPLISKAVQRALDSENTYCNFSWGVGVRKREIQMLAERITEIGIELGTQNGGVSEEGKSFDAEILKAESEIMAARREDEQAQQELDKASADMAKVAEEYSDVAAGIKRAPNKSAKQKLSKRKHDLDPIKSRSLAQHDAAVKSAAAAQARLYNALSALEALNARKARLPDAPERVRERVIAIEQKLAAECARISQLQQALDSDIAQFLDKECFRNDEELRQKALVYLRN